MTALLPLTDEQRLLADSADRFFRDSVPDASMARERWSRMAELGWLGVSVPEALGGIGGGSLEEMLILMAAGAGQDPLPLLSAGVLAPRLLAALPHGEAMNGHLDSLLSGEAIYTVVLEPTDTLQTDDMPQAAAAAGGAGWSLTGRCPLVVNAGLADRLIVPFGLRATPGAAAETAVAVIPRKAQNLKITEIGSFAGMDVGSVDFQGVDVTPEMILARGSAADSAMAYALECASGAISAALAGLASQLLEDTLSYVKVRSQFGQVIGGFQALQHRLADMHVAVEEAVSLAMSAALAIDRPTAPEDRKEAISLARSGISERARLVAREAVQLHGGMGMTEELRVGPGFRLTKALDIMFRLQ